MKRAFTIIGILFLVISGVAQNGNRFSTDLRFNEISINGSTTPELHSGDTLVFTISIENIGNEPYRDCMLSISTNNPSIIFIDSTEYFDYIAPGNEYTLNRCLIAVIAPNIPDRNSILFTFSISNSTEEVLLQRSYRVSGINLTAESIHIFANGIAQRTFHPSECGSLAITLKNNSAQDLHYINIDILARMIPISQFPGTHRFPFSRPGKPSNTVRNTPLPHSSNPATRWTYVSATT